MGFIPTIPSFLCAFSLSPYIFQYFPNLTSRTSSYFPISPWTFTYFPEHCLVISVFSNILLNIPIFLKISLDTLFTNSPLGIPNMSFKFHYIFREFPVFPTMSMNICVFPNIFMQIPLFCISQYLSGCPCIFQYLCGHSRIYKYLWTSPWFPKSLRTFSYFITIPLGIPAFSNTFEDFSAFLSGHPLLPNIYLLYIFSYIPKSLWRSPYFQKSVNILVLANISLAVSVIPNTCMTSPYSQITLDISVFSNITPDITKIS